MFIELSKKENKFGFPVEGGGKDPNKTVLNLPLSLKNIQNFAALGDAHGYI